uniref:DPH-type MB domain-containing protein n=1 Tax=Steinernema glaseri TaxID=37863 RepID=A0A1I7ZY06_9BILA
MKSTKRLTTAGEERSLASHLKESRSVIGEEVKLSESSDEEPCRCGGFYDISEADLDQIVDFALIDCAHCSLTLKVLA